MVAIGVTDGKTKIEFEIENRIQVFITFSDRPHQYRRQYPGSGGPMNRDFPPRYNRSPGRFDMSPPQNKRPRRDW